MKAGVRKLGLIPRTTHSDVKGTAFTVSLASVDRVHARAVRGCVEGVSVGQATWQARVVVRHTRFCRWLTLREKKAARVHYSVRAIPGYTIFAR